MDRTFAGVAVVASLLAAGAVVGLARAGEDATPPPKPPEAAEGLCPPPKPLRHVFLDGLLGSWTTVCRGSCGGEGRAAVTFARGVGGTALLQTYDSTLTGPDGETATFHGHAVYKLADDGKTLSFWWFDSSSPEPTKFSGPVGEKGYEVEGASPHGTLVLTLETTASGPVFRMRAGDAEIMTETYTRVK